MKNFIDELKWRGMLQDIIPGTETHLNKNKSLGYIVLIQHQIRYTLEVLFQFLY